MNERRHSRTPFTYKQFEQGQWVITDADGQPVAVVPGTEGHASFICKSCNRYDRLYEALILCKGEFEGLSRPRRRPAYRDLMVIAAEIERDGR